MSHIKLIRLANKFEDKYLLKIASVDPEFNKIFAREIGIDAQADRDLESYFNLLSNRSRGMMNLKSWYINRRAPDPTIKDFNSLVEASDNIVGNLAKKELEVAQQRLPQSCSKDPNDNQIECGATTKAEAYKIWQKTKDPLQVRQFWSQQIKEYDKFFKQIINFMSYNDQLIVNLIDTYNKASKYTTDLTFEYFFGESPR